MEIYLFASLLILSPAFWVFVRNSHLLFQRKEEVI